MSSLRNLQAGFRTALFTQEDGPIAAEVLSDGLGASARVAVYRHHVRTTLTEALVSTFPVVCRLVDRRFFGWLADCYVRKHPRRGRVSSSTARICGIHRAIPGLRGTAVARRRGAARVGDERGVPRSGRANDPFGATGSDPGGRARRAHLRIRAFGHVRRVTLADRCDLARQSAKR